MGETSRRYRFTDSYREHVVLRDGQRLRLRTVRPSDKLIMRDAFERLSPASRHARFMTAKSSLTEQDLRYLTEVDGADHFALGAMRPSWRTRNQGIGVGRFVRLGHANDTAEPAITVIDDYHGKGLGSILLERLTQAAWERDIRWFHVEVHSENLASKRLFGALSPGTEFRRSDAGTLFATIPLPPPPDRPGAPAPFLESATSFMATARPWRLP